MSSRPAAVVPVGFAAGTAQERQHVGAREERDQLYPRLILHEDPGVPNVARSFRQTMGGLAADFKSFYDHWIAAGAIDSDPQRFFCEADRFLGALLHRVEREDEVLYALADTARSASRLNDR
jgi:hypothetical protein